MGAVKSQELVSAQVIVENTGPADDVKAVVAALRGMVKAGKRTDVYAVKAALAAPKSGARMLNTEYEKLAAGDGSMPPLGKGFFEPAVKTARLVSELALTTADEVFPLVSSAFKYGGKDESAVRDRIFGALTPGVDAADVAMAAEAVIAECRDIRKARKSAKTEGTARTGQVSEFDEAADDVTGPNGSDTVSAAAAIMTLLAQARAGIESGTFTFAEAQAIEAAAHGISSAAAKVARQAKNRAAV